MVLIDQSNRASDIAAGPISLHPRRRKEHMDRTSASRNYVQNVSDRTACRRGDNGQTPRKHWQRRLQMFGKESFCLQSTSKLFEGNSMRAGSNRVEGFNDEFVVSAGVV